MNIYGFLLAHGYQLYKGYVNAENEEEARKKILNEDWDDIIDEYDTDVLTKGYEIVELWESW